MSVDLDQAFELQTLISQDGRDVCGLCDKARPDEKCTGRDATRTRTSSGKSTARTQFRLWSAAAVRPTKSGDDARCAT